MAEATAAILVVYHAASDPEPVIAQLAASLGSVVVVDNTATGHPRLEAATLPAGVRVLHNANAGALAGAYNRALEHLLGRPPGLQQVVLVDEDSDATVLQALLADAKVQALLADPHTAAVAPAYCDRATGLRGKHIQLGRWRLRYLPRRFDGLQPVAFVINSMSVWRLAALQAIGPFDEGLRVDHVDTDYCLRARRAGLQVWLHGSHEFRHAIGERRRYRLFGRELQAGGHAPQRRYLIGRNTAWLGRRYLWREPAFAFLCLTRLAYEAVGIVMAEPQRVAKLGALLRGMLVGLLSRRLG
ncbi:glycosyltransferase [Aquincola sp. S2]|uniref:Glycosyltransferase n=1 Tax=Pseudaquabacterium terrae TaxID=2732868 RepID=A0ABX2EDX8_9BURK|nr:glycosyltransferase [Aquabacterium terrae]